MTFQLLHFSGRRFSGIGLLLCLDCVILGDLQSLMSRHAIITNEFRAFNAPTGGRFIVHATAAFNDGRFRITITRILCILCRITGNLFHKKLIVDYLIDWTGHTAHRTVNQWWHRTIDIIEFGGHTTAARHMQAFKQFRGIASGQILRTPHTLVLRWFSTILRCFVNLQIETIIEIQLNFWLRVFDSLTSWRIISFYERCLHIEWHELRNIFFSHKFGKIESLWWHQELHVWLITRKFYSWKIPCQHDNENPPIVL